MRRKMRRERDAPLRVPERSNSRALMARERRAREEDGAKLRAMARERRRRADRRRLASALAAKRASVRSPRVGAVRSARSFARPKGARESAKEKKSAARVSACAPGRSRSSLGSSPAHD
ncbi:hypothetical protein MRX96_057649 [Rhipicephalus microplus]